MFMRWITAQGYLHIQVSTAEWHLTMESRRKRYSTAETLEKVFRDQSSESDSESETGSDGETSSTDDTGKCIIASDTCYGWEVNFESDLLLDSKKITPGRKWLEICDHLLI